MTAQIFSIADRRPRPGDGRAARLPQGARQGAGVESGETMSPQTSGDIAVATQPRVAQNAAQQLPVTRDADTDKGSGVPLNVEGERTLPPPLPSSLVATINTCPVIRIDGRTTYLLGSVGVAFRDAIGWRWAASIGGPAHDIWNEAFTEALEERATKW